MKCQNGAGEVRGVSRGLITNLGIKITAKIMLASMGEDVKT